MGAADSPYCTHWNVPETMEHFLLTSQRYTPLRATLRSITKLHNLQLRHLLSFGSKHIKHVLRYTIRSGRFTALSKADDSLPSHRARQWNGGKTLVGLSTVSVFTVNTVGLYGIRPRTVETLADLETVRQTVRDTTVYGSENMAVTAIFTVPIYKHMNFSIYGLAIHECEST